MEKKPKHTGGKSSALVKLYQRGVGKALVALAISAVAVGSAAGCGGNDEAREAAQGPSGRMPGIGESDVAPPNVTMEQAAGKYASTIRRGPGGILSPDAVPYVPSPDRKPLEVDAAIPWVDLPEERKVAGVGVFEEIDEEPTGAAEGPADLASADGAAKDPWRKDAGRPLPIIELEPASLLVAEHSGRGAETAAVHRSADHASATRDKPTEEVVSQTTQAPFKEQQNKDVSPVDEVAEGEEPPAGPMGESGGTSEVVPEQEQKEPPIPPAEPPTRLPSGGEAPAAEVPPSSGGALLDGEDSGLGGTPEGTAPVAFEESAEEPTAFFSSAQQPGSTFVQPVEDDDVVPTPETPAGEPVFEIPADEVPVEAPVGGDAPEEEYEVGLRGNETEVKVGEGSAPSTPGQEQPPSTPEATSLPQPFEESLEGEVAGSGTATSAPSRVALEEPVVPEVTDDTGAAPASGDQIEERSETDGGLAQSALGGEFGPADIRDQGPSEYEPLPAKEGGLQAEPSATPAYGEQVGPPQGAIPTETAGEPAVQAPPFAQPGAQEEFAQQPAESISAQPTATQPVSSAGAQQAVEERWAPGGWYEELPPAAQSPATEQTVVEPLASGYAQPVSEPAYAETAQYGQPAYGTADQYSPAPAYDPSTAYDGQGTYYNEPAVTEPQAGLGQTATEQPAAGATVAYEEPAYDDEGSASNGQGTYNEEPAYEANQYYSSPAPTSVDHEELPPAAQSLATEQAVNEPAAYEQPAAAAEPAAYEEPVYGTDQYTSGAGQAASDQPAYAKEGPAYYEQPPVVSGGTAIEEPAATVEPAVQEEPASDEGPSNVPSEPAYQPPAAQEGTNVANAGDSEGGWEAGMGSF